MQSDEQIEYWIAMMKGISNDGSLSKEQKASDLETTFSNFSPVSFLGIYDNCIYVSIIFLFTEIQIIRTTHFVDRDKSAEEASCSGILDFISYLKSPSKLHI